MLSNGSRWVLVVLGSAGVHALALWALSTTSAPKPSQPRTPFELVFETAEAPPPREEVKVEAPPAPPPHAAPTPRRPPASEAAAANRASEQAASSASEAGAQATASGTTGDLPLARGPNLLPSMGSVFSMPQAASAEPTGTTLRNGPGEEPDAVIAKEVEGEVLTRKLNADLLHDLGEAAVAVGSVPGHFRQVENAMRKSLAGQRVDMGAKSAGDEARDIARILLTPGISAEAARKVTDTPLGRSVQSGSVPMANAEDQRFREQALQLMAAGEAIKERMQAPQLKTVLEMTTDASGGLADVTVIEKSGDPRFDESVIHLSRKVFRSLPENDDKALGTSWWRTRWQFTYEPPQVRVKLIGAHRVNPL